MRRGTVYDPERVLHNVEAADAADRVREDVDELIRADAVFDAEKAVAAVRREYRFLASLEPVERDFLAGARYWLGDLGAARAGAPKDWGHPLARLFEGTADVTAEAREATWDSLRVFGKEPIN